MTELSFVRWGKVPLLFLYVHKNYVNTTVNGIAALQYSGLSLEQLRRLRFRAKSIILRPHFYFTGDSYFPSQNYFCERLIK